MTVDELRVVSADGTGIVATDQGRGPVILVVPPGSSGPSSWARVAALLASRYRVLRLRRRIYAGSPPVLPHTMATEVADVLAVAGAVGGPALLVGHSSGGVVALETALAAPSRFAGMLLYEPPVAPGGAGSGQHGAVTGPLGGAALVRARAALDAGRPGRAMAIHLRELVGLPAPLVAAMRLVPPVWRQLTAMAAGQIADDEAIEALGVGLDRYADLAVPARLLGGARSPAHLRTRLDALAGTLPRVESVVLLPGQGHTANLRAPAAVARVVGEFAGSVLGAAS